MPSRPKRSRNVDSLVRLYDDWRSFRAFCSDELATGGPDHHVSTIAYLACYRFPDDGAWRRRAWLVACYMGPYTVPGGLAIWDAHPWPPQTDEQAERVTQWCERNIELLRPAMRRERRPVKVGYGRNLAEYLNTAATWVWQLDRDASFDDLWTSARADVKYVGRYATMKLLEALRRAGVTSAAQPDIRAADTQSVYSRWALSHLYPAHDADINACTTDRDARRTATLVEELSAKLQRELALPDMYTTEVLLCDWRQHLDGRYPPGKPLDSELRHLATVQANFPDLAGWVTDWVLGARRALFPPECLTELR